MKRNSWQHFFVTGLLAVFVLVCGCHKKVASTPAVSQPPQPAQASASVAPAPASAVRPSPAPAPVAAPSLDQLFRQNVKDAFFDYNQAELRSDAKQVLEGDAEFLRSHAQARISVEGHCDERGSEEYNLGLGDRRATAVKQFLVDLGIPDSRIQTTSYGKERPFCQEQTDACWQQNRRGHLVLMQ